MASLAAHSALQIQSLIRDEFSVREIADSGLIRLQTFHRGVGSVENVAEALGMSLPGPGEVLASDAITVYWSSPGEWIIRVPIGSEQEQLVSLQSRFEGLFAVVTLMTDSRVTLELSGVMARDVLARGSSVDFHPSVFGNNRCLSTRLAGVPIMLAHSAQHDTYLLFACRSTAHYLLDWFLASSEDC